jgi:hypothetical protein
MTAEQAREFIKAAPQAETKAPDLAGFQFAQGGDDPESRQSNGGPWFLCARCAARLMIRGCSWSGRESMPVWTDQIHGNCDVCGKR